MQRLLSYLFILFLTFSLAACGGETETASAPETSQQETSAAQTITITPVGNEMKYEKTSFTVQPGQEVTIVFNNTATSPAMQHNVVVLNGPSNDLIQQVGQAAMQAGAENDYIPSTDAVGDVILAHTAMSKPGETVQVTFTAPEEPGDYAYICTFPGHYAMMQGVMHVEA